LRSQRHRGSVLQWAKQRKWKVWERNCLQKIKQLRKNTPGSARLKNKPLRTQVRRQLYSAGRALLMKITWGTIYRKREKSMAATTSTRRHPKLSNQGGRFLNEKKGGEKLNVPNLEAPEEQGVTWEDTQPNRKAGNRHHRPNERRSFKQPRLKKENRKQRKTLWKKKGREVKCAVGYYL